ncbi:gamma-glutamylcyclotransferase family protein [Microbacterium sp. 179-B 1A2 NHS]|uniref:gamma-glutamylcyclotransferase family protein n=1 Tax=Microbacterium sp. 179-B 1A2 NHS TaxID=3142383 RepID=UPI0039A0FC78
MTAPRLERLFVYGALRQRDLQLDTFGRIVESEPGILPGYTASVQGIADGRFTDAGGPVVQPVLRRTGDPLDKVPGEVLRLELIELEAADEVQMATFRRTRVRLSDGKDAWVYL